MNRHNERNVRHAHPHRRPLRLQGYDYAQAGAYFVTVCTRDRLCALGDVVNGEMVLSPAGHLAHAAWQVLPQHYPGARLDAWVIMPNHVHGIIWLADNERQTVGAGFKPARRRPDAVGTGPKPAQWPSDPPRPRSGPVGAGFEPARHGLPEIVRAFKTFSARRINQARNTTGSQFWQRNYYEHVIRSEDALTRIRQYIADNPAKWHEDPENPNVATQRR